MRPVETDCRRSGADCVAHESDVRAPSRPHSTCPACPLAAPAPLAPPAAPVRLSACPPVRLSACPPVRLSACSACSACPPAPPAPRRSRLSRVGLLLRPRLLSAVQASTLQSVWFCYKKSASALAKRAKHNDNNSH